MTWWHRRLRHQLNLRRRRSISFFLTKGQEEITSREQFSERGVCDPNSAYSPSGASTVYGDALRAGKSITVETLDFVDWFRKLNLRERDRVAMKMDIEGAERDIMLKMLEPLPYGLDEEPPTDAGGKTQQQALSPACLVDTMWMEYHKAIFPDGSDLYRQHEAFQREFPLLFRKRCGRDLTIGGWH
jgi:Methyltransferase FkbM domain